MYTLLQINLGESPLYKSILFDRALLNAILSDTVLSLWISPWMPLPWIPYHLLGYQLLNHLIGYTYGPLWSCPLRYIQPTSTPSSCWVLDTAHLDTPLEYCFFNITQGRRSWSGYSGHGWTTFRPSPDPVNHIVCFINQSRFLSTRQEIITQGRRSWCGRPGSHQTSNLPT